MITRRFVMSLVLLLVLMLSAIPGSGTAQSRPTVPDDVATSIAESKAEATYIVQMLADPAVAYEGEFPGLPATKPGRGEKLNPNSQNVRQYVAFLQSEHNRALNAVGAGRAKIYDYVYSFNGFSATLTPDQAAQLSTMPDVVAVSPEEIRQLETDNSPDFLGLSAPGGLWDEVGGQENAGDGIVVGIIDTGIWPEHPSFSDDLDGDRQSDYDPPEQWFGSCSSGEQLNQQDCNNKLVGIQDYRKGMGTGTAGVLDPTLPDDYLSGRDADGHGTHTASTAAGNPLEAEDVTIFGEVRGPISGIAPRAHIAAYKVCWNNLGCFLSDIVAAIDQAVADGVDVINYSIGGGPSLLGADDVAFLFADDAGVFVATSAGNSGPGPGTVGGPATVPWVTSVGASTQDRTFQGSVVLGSSAEYFGASITGGTGVLPLVDSEDAGSPLCIPGELDPAVVSGNIVLCLRGEIARVDKSLAVFQAGGAGMVLYNENDAQSQVTDNHWVPSVHINHTDGEAIKTYIASAGASATGQINGGELTTIDAPWMADFSSRGPDVVAEDIIKPDVTAPGVNILAGNTPNPFLGAPDQLFQAISGTSMSSPHVAGVAALLRQANPDWTPEMVKSALMTTASQDVMKEDGTTPADPFDMGGGHIAPTSAADPGLVYDASFLDYLAFLCPTGAVAPATCDALESSGFSFDASDLNLASIGIADLAGDQTVTRTVTNVGPGATYNVSIDAPPGVTVSVSPSSLTLNNGDTASYNVTFTTQSGADLDEWAFGSLTWSHGPHNVRSPLAIKPVALAAPDEVFGSGTAGNLSYDVTFGYSGDFNANPYGLFPADMQPNTVADDPSNDINAALDTCDFSSFPFDCTGITWHAVSVPAGSVYARISLFDDYTDGSDDLDLYVFDSALGFVGSSGTATSEEEVNIVDPAAGTYFVAVHGWETDGADAAYTLFNWAVQPTAMTNMGVTAPSSATLGGSATVTVDWTGLDNGMKYLGSVAYDDGGGVFDFTIVRIDTD